ncbi:MAG: hypothetical protein PHR53_04245 [Bacteroidales bacterium]|nr:hypothetical protein [Bacteroidales bacterium]
MKTSFDNIDKIFTFEGLWGIESKCGLKIIHKNDKIIVIVSELYLENPGTSVTQAVNILPLQIAEHFQIPLEKMTYIEHNPDMHSKLSFYDEEFFLVTLNIKDGQISNSIYRQLNSEEIKTLIL